MTLRRPVWALYVLVVGLAVHNFVMAMLWRAGVRGGALTVISAWKEALLLIALVLVVAERRALPFSRRFVPDLLALAFAAFVVVYALIPQSVLEGGATNKGIAYALRHDLLIVGAYFLGRGLDLTDKERARLCHVVLATAAFVAVVGLVDVYAVSLAWWRLSAGWYQHQLGLDYGPGLSHLPENFVYNAGNNVVFRRLTSTFLSPLASAYLLVVAMFSSRFGGGGGSRSARCCSRRSSGRTPARPSLRSPPAWSCWRSFAGARSSSAGRRPSWSSRSRS